MNKTYTQMKALSTFLERYKYLRIKNRVGDATFGFNRYLNQSFYSSRQWRSTRDKVIIRDNGCDLACEGYEINDRVYVHHINPIGLEDVENEAECLYDLNNLVCVSYSTHLAIHYSDESLLPPKPVIRRPNDTCPWR